MTDVYRVPFNYSRTSLNEVKTLAERGNLVLFNENGRVGYVDPDTKQVKYLSQNADEVSYDNKYFDGNLTGVSANLQALAKYIDELSTSDIPIGDYDGNLSGLTTLEDALEALDGLTGSGISAPGSDGNVIYNSGGSFGASSEVNWDGNEFAVQGDINGAQGIFSGDVTTSANVNAVDGLFTGTITASLFSGTTVSIGSTLTTVSLYATSIFANSVSLTGNLFMDGIAKIRAIDPATSTSTGALQVDGGISVDEASWFGGDLLLEGGDLTLDHGGLVNAVINLHGSTEFLIRATATDTFQIRDKTAAANRMTIDASGDTTFSGNVSDDSGNVRNNIDTEFLKAYTTYYTEYTYTSGDLTQVDVWDSAGKTTKLFTKVLAYTTGNLTSVTLTDEVNSNTLTKTLTYDGSGNLDTLTRSYS